MEKITVLHVCDKFGVSGSSIHGVSRLFSWWFPRFDRQRFNVLLCGMKKQDAGGKTLQNSGIDITYLGKSKFDPTVLLSLMSLMKRVKPDVLHLHGYAACTFGRIAGRICGVPAIVHEHFADPAYPVYMKIADGILGRGSQCSIAVSESVKQFLIKERGIPEGTIEIVYNGVPLDEFRKADEKEQDSIRKELNIDANKIVIGSVGRLNPEKGVDDFIRAAEAVAKYDNNVVFFIIGDGPQREELDELIVKLRLQENVFLLGHRVDIPAILAVTDIFVISSHREGVPLTAFEAMAAGKAIIATKVGGIPEILEDRKTTLFVKPQQPAMITSAITELLQNKELRARLGENAREKSRRFDVREAIQKIQDIYVRLSGKDG